MLAPSAPRGGQDMLGYLYIIAAAQHEFNLSACMSYDVAFRKKAAKFHLTSWGQLDTQIYACAFTGSDEVRPTTRCSLCLGTRQSITACNLYSSGPAKQPQANQAGPRHTGPSSSPTTPTTTSYIMHQPDHKSSRTTSPLSAPLATPLAPSPHHHFPTS